MTAVISHDARHLELRRERSRGGWNANARILLQRNAAFGHWR
jgi:hypothetical protein